MSYISLASILVESDSVVLITETRPPVSYYTTLPPPPGIMRRSDVARLKELRRRLDSGQCTLEEINQITVELMGECAEVSLHLPFAGSGLMPARIRLHWQHGHPETIREMFPRTSIRNVATSRSPSSRNWSSQERYMGSTKDYRMLHNR
jgi:hypothetical protein